MKTTAIDIAHGLALAIELATSKCFIAGKTGSGKTNTAGRLVEGIMAAGVPVAILDPADAWWGLQFNPDGTPSRHEVYVFGGRRQHLPLEQHAGATLADVLVDHRVSMVLSMRHMSGLERSRFVRDFANRLLQRNEEPVHIVLEEAHELAPQQPPKGEQAEQMLGAVKRLWKLGRGNGIGGTAITQRPAALHKDVTTSADILIVHRTIGPQDVEAIRNWVKYHRQREDILPELAGLKTGEGFLWAPDFPEANPIGLRRLTFKLRATFDSSATPKIGEKRATPGEAKPLDIQRLGEKLASTIERQKATDPQELQARIRALEQELRQVKDSKPSAPPAAPKLVNVVTEASAKRLEAALSRYERVAGVLGEALGRLREELAQAARETVVGKSIVAPLLEATLRPPAAPTAPAPPRPKFDKDGELREPGTGLQFGEARILNTIAMLQWRGIDTNKDSVARWQDLHPNGNRYNSQLASLRRGGYLAEGFTLTDKATRIARYGETGAMEAERALAGMKEIGAQAARIFKTVRETGPYSSKEALAAALGIHHNGNRFNSGLARLRVMGLIPERGVIKLTPGAER